MTYSFQQTQLAFTQYLRDPETGVPTNLPSARMQVYLELIYNNIEGFLSGSFPVLRSIIPDDKWHGLARDFIKQHRAQTPYFLEISQEFLSYLFQANHSLVSEYPFILALAHYEWVELALDISEDELPDPTPWPSRLLETSISLSPLSMLLAYPWPVHKISNSFIPEKSEGDTHLMVYRDRQDDIQFMELTAVSSRFLQLCRDNPQSSLQQQLDLLTQELDSVSIPRLLPKLEALLKQLYQLDLLFFVL